MTITADMLSVQIFADGADKPSILTLAANPLIQGFTTNPTLMRKAGIPDYEAFARDILTVDRRPAHLVRGVLRRFRRDVRSRRARSPTWGDNVYVKIPVTNTNGESAVPPDREPGARPACR